MTAFNEVLARNTDQAPKVESASQTVAFSHYNHFSAILPIDPATGELVEGGALEQATRSFESLKAILESIDRKLDDVVRITVLLTDIADLEAVNEAQKKFYGEYFPTRTVIAVQELQKGAKLAIEAVVSHGLGTIPNAPQADDLVKLARNTDRAPKCDVATQTVAFSHYNNISAQLGIDPETGKLVEGGIEAEAKQAFDNLKAILESVDAPFDDIVKITIFLKDLADLEAVNTVYTTFFPDSAIARAIAYVPARTVVEVADLPHSARVSVEAVVSHGDGTPPQAVEDRHGIVIWASNTDQAPRSELSTQTVAFSHYNNLSAQIGVDLEGKLVDGGVKAEAKQALEHIKAIVEHIDHKLADIVKINLYLTDLADLAAVEEVYGEYFPEGTPARRVVKVGKLAEGASVMIDAVVSNAEGTPRK